MWLRRKRNRVLHEPVAGLVVTVAVLWNFLVAFSFIYPHNHHALWLPTYPSTLIADAIIGSAWLVVVFSFLFKRWRVAANLAARDAERSVLHRATVTMPRAAPRR